jgi:glyoxylase-like metal-dependent hydrolase (beta-lactamase superfamily II)
MHTSRRTLRPRLVLAAALLVGGAGAGCSEHFMLKTGMETIQTYFEGPVAEGVRLDKIGDDTYSFKFAGYRNLVLLTNEGVAVFDPLGPEAAKALRDAIAKAWPGRKVSHLVYSHYHLDHASGGGVLQPEKVIGHAKCAKYWEELGAAKDVVAINQPIEGDQTLDVGGREVRAIYLGRSHSDTLYAYHLPKERLLFGVDIAVVRAVPPGGHPDSYQPGMEAAWDRVSAIDFDVFVPGHFDPGTKKDMLDSIAMERELRRLVKESLAKYPPHAKGALVDNFEYVYTAMRPRYGEWHGFSAMFIANMMNAAAGEIVGF